MKEFVLTSRRFSCQKRTAPGQIQVIQGNFRVHGRTFNAVGLRPYPSKCVLFHVARSDPFAALDFEYSTSSAMCPQPVSADG